MRRGGPKQKGAKGRRTKEGNNPSLIKRRRSSMVCAEGLWTQSQEKWISGAKLKQTTKGDRTQLYTASNAEGLGAQITPLVQNARILGDSGRVAGQRPKRRCFGL